MGLPAVNGAVPLSVLHLFCTIRGAFVKFFRQKCPHHEKENYDEGFSFAARQGA